MNDNFKGVWIAKDILAIKNINLTQKLILAILVNLSQKDGECKPSNGYLSIIVGISKTSISINLNILYKLDYIGCTIKLKEGTQEVLHRVCKPTYRGYASKLIDPPQAKLHTSPSQLIDPPQAKFKGIDIVYSKEYNKEERKEEPSPLENGVEKKDPRPINKIIQWLESEIGGMLDGSIYDNEANCLDCLEKIEKDFPNDRAADLLFNWLSSALEDDFHKKNLTNFKYIFRNLGKLRLCHEAINEL